MRCEGVPADVSSDEATTLVTTQWRSRTRTSWPTSGAAIVMEAVDIGARFSLSGGAGVRRALARLAGWHFRVRVPPLGLRPGSTHFSKVTLDAKKIKVSTGTRKAGFERGRLQLSAEV